jgi:hypothetical protein
MRLVCATDIASSRPQQLIDNDCHFQPFMLPVNRHDCRKSTSLDTIFVQKAGFVYLA